SPVIALVICQSRAWIGIWDVMLCEGGRAEPLGQLGLEAQRGALGRPRGVVSTGDLLQLIVGQLDQGLLLEQEGLELVGLLVLLHGWTSGLGLDASITVVSSGTGGIARSRSCRRRASHRRG